MGSRGELLCDDAAGALLKDLTENIQVGPGGDVRKFLIFADVDGGKSTLGVSVDAGGELGFCSRRQRYLLGG